MAPYPDGLSGEALDDFLGDIETCSQCNRAIRRCQCVDPDIAYEDYRDRSES